MSRPICESCGKPVIHREGVDWCWDRQVNEAVLQSRVIARAKRLGWEIQHVGKGIATFDSNGDPVYVTTGNAGWPDLTLAKAGHRLIFIELKRQDGVVSTEQWKWLGLLNACGARAVVIRPSDLREKRVNAILKFGSPL